jgi:hypothetical protein
MRLRLGGLRDAWRDSVYRLQSWRNSFDPAGNLMIFSEPRGGSTWITETIAAVPRTAILWEPLFIKHVEAFRNLGFAVFQHIPEEAEWPEAEQAFERLLRGRILNYWTCRQTTMKAMRRADRLILKICRGNALLPWLTRKFAFRYEPVYLVRHPLAVVASQLRQGGWDWEYSGFKVPGPPFNEIYAEHDRYLRGLKTKEEALTAGWCLTNLVPLRSSGNDHRWITVHYEDLIRDPGRGIRRIFDRWGTPIPDGIMEKVRGASSTTREATFEQSIEMQLSKWQEHLTADQQKRMLDVLEYFGVHEYGADPLPTLCGTSRADEHAPSTRSV